MGINGLLPFLKSIQQPTHIKNWKGQRVAVDAYGWLHRGTISCAVDLALEKPTTRYVDYAMHRVRMLQHYGVTPYLVFDGDYLPGKKGTEFDREKKRKISRAAGLELLRLGRTTQAYAELQKSIDVTPLMARRLIEELKKANIPYIVAPYEADAQMAYLERIGEVSAILSEDSDLLVFGAKCLLTKLGQYGDCIAINRSDFSKISEANMAGWSDSEFRKMAILSGCDYLVNIPKMGIKTAYKFVRKYKSIDKIIRAIRMDGSFVVPASYEKSFATAEMTFQYQRVYCPISNQLLSCNGEKVLPLDIGAEQALNFGAIYDSEIASKVASGDLDPITKIELRLALSVSTASSRNLRITSFFSRSPSCSEPSYYASSKPTIQTVPRTAPPANPRTILAELGSHNILAKPQESVEPSSYKTNPKNTMRETLSHETESKKRRLCMDDDTENALNTERSPFFTKPSKIMKIPAKRAPLTSLGNSLDSKLENSTHRQKSGVPNLINRSDSAVSANSTERDTGENTDLREESPEKPQAERPSFQTPDLKIASLASFRFQPNSTSTIITKPSVIDLRDKENFQPY